MQREKLAVEIARSDRVVVDEIERAHAAAQQCLERIAAHSAEPEERDARAPQPLHALAAEEHPCPG